MQLQAKKVIGIWVRTTNHEQQALQDIQSLWAKFMSENVISKIPNRIADTIYSIYTEYEGDYTKPYTTVLACEVSTLDQIPKGMKGLELASGSYQKYTAKGDINQGAIGAKWMEIWQADIDRNYIADFEVYDERAQNPEDVIVDIYVGIN